MQLVFEIVMTSVLAEFRTRQFSLYHFEAWSMLFSFTSIETIGVSTLVTNKQSSANKEQFSSLIKSLMNIMKSKGPSTDPCGSQVNTFWQSEMCPLTFIACSLPTRYFWIRLKAFWWKLNFWANFVKRNLWLTQSNAFRISTADRVTNLDSG